jgi:NADH-quinone oxidoreductase subunit N
LVVCLLGFVGTPPTAVFVGKVLMFGAAIDGHYAWLAAVAAVNSVASVFYYLRWIVPIFRRPDGPLRPARAASAVAIVAALFSLVLGIGAGLALTG